MQRMIEMGGPRIEEIVDPPSPSNSVLREADYRQNGPSYSRPKLIDQIRTLIRTPNFNKDAVKMGRVIDLMELQIGEWQEEQIRYGFTQEREDAIYQYKHKVIV
uniref:Uncharacterized protein n=1 Tax=Caenorhabditis japonica TaxID=281687 RepID=A0A8R1EE26_CAEJA